MKSFFVENALNFYLMARTCSVVVAVTEQTGMAPTGWSDHFLATQQLSVRLEETLAGAPLKDPKLTLAVPIVRNSRISAATPELAKWIGKPGSRIICFIKDGKIVDEDLGIVEGTPEVIESMRKLIDGPLPVGSGSLLHLLSESADRQPEVKSCFEGLLPVVADIEEKRKTTARLTVVDGKLRVFTGIRLKRVLNGRNADIVIRTNRKQVGQLLLGRARAKELTVKGEAPELLKAIDSVGQSRLLQESTMEQILAAAGLRDEVAEKKN